MESRTDGVPTKRRRTEGKIPQETMLEALLWLDRFDLDGKHITTRRLCSLIENKQTPLRKVHRVEYNGEWRNFNFPPGKSSLSIFFRGSEFAEIELRIETNADAQKAVSYLSSCFVRYFSVFGHRAALPKKSNHRRTAAYRKLEFRLCNFDDGEEDTLIGTLDGSAFQSLKLDRNYFFAPGGQVHDKRMEWLRLHACNELYVVPYDMEPADGGEKFRVSEKAILGYCFTLDDNFLMLERRTLRIAGANITPPFFKKIVEASKNSPLTCDVELRLEHVQLDVSKIEFGVLPSRHSEYDIVFETHRHDVRYNTADHGNGIRLLIHLKSENGEEWNVTMRHGRRITKDSLNRSRLNMINQGPLEAKAWLRRLT